MENRLGHTQESLEAKVTLLLDHFPEYKRTLRLALAHQELGSKSRNYEGWQWHDVEIHPTKLIRLVTEGICRISLRTRQTTYYLLRSPEAVKKVVNEQ